MSEDPSDKKDSELNKKGITLTGILIAIGNIETILNVIDKGGELVQQPWVQGILKGIASMAGLGFQSVLANRQASEASAESSLRAIKESTDRQLIALPIIECIYDYRGKLAKIYEGLGEDERSELSNKILDYIKESLEVPQGNPYDVLTARLDKIYISRFGLN